VAGYDGRVTVAAVMLFTSPDDALVDTAGRSAVRRMVESAWAGGATPIVVVAADPSGSLAAALAGSPAILAEPPGAEAGQVQQLLRGARIASERVVETDAVLLWPGRMAWVDAETVTSLIERHGVERESLLRPEYDGQPGWPALLPIDFVVQAAHVAPESDLGQLIEGLAGVRPLSLFDTGDPGTLNDATVALDEMPVYAGPPEPARQAPEWGMAAADSPEDLPLEGPALAPYSQAADPESD